MWPTVCCRTARQHCCVLLGVATMKLSSGWCRVDRIPAQSVTRFGSGAVDMLAAAMRCEPWPRSVVQDDHTALHLACIRGHLGVVKYLITHCGVEASLDRDEVDGLATLVSPRVPSCPLMSPRVLSCAHMM
jgi:hypothetical protein